MDYPFSFYSSSEVFHGDFYSVFVAGPESYWVVSNDFPCVYEGPFDMGTALKIMHSSNQTANLFNLKGLLF